ncbi:hypothetical protein MKK67_11570 [Methylobacterium sp. J-072]|uniref:hypothetical protein n=1 Tax=Methylobacterium sp. J-072 TaxID=2836651 RepID=UPI001FB99252|nr:hypothetical protein [Methylobacterium sp. J-072]MCJ2093130.1 hypothetical protein [Methylobacterium sp. J-072]
MADEDVRTSHLTVEEFWWASAFLAKAVCAHMPFQQRAAALAAVASTLDQDARAMPDGNRIRAILLGASKHVMHLESGSAD